MNDITIAPVETRYKGYRFRSRLEARWAVFFDAMGFDWEYEREGYDLGEYGWYLPDFYLFAGYVEIKPSNFEKSDYDNSKFKQFVKTTGFELILVRGLPACKNYDLYWLPFEHGPVECNDEYQSFVPWKKDNRLTFDALICDFEEDSKYLDAINSALSARFEHGECGGVSA